MTTNTTAAENNSGATQAETEGADLIGIHQAKQTIDPEDMETLLDLFSTYHFSPDEDGSSDYEGQYGYWGFRTPPEFQEADELLYNNAPALILMASRTLDAEQKLAEALEYKQLHAGDVMSLSNDLLDTEERLQDALKQAQEATARAERAEGEVETWRRRANTVVEKLTARFHEVDNLKKALQNASMIGRRIQAHSTASEKVKELAQHLRRICEEAYSLSKPSILRDTILPSPPLSHSNLCQCPTGPDGVRRIDETCPVCMAEGAE